MTPLRFLFVFCTATILIVPSWAQRPEMVRDDRTGTIAIFLDAAEANRLRAGLARSVLDAGYDTVTQTTLCLTSQDQLREQSTYDWDMIKTVKNAEGQAMQPSSLRQPEHDDIGQLIGFEYTILYRSKDSSGTGRASVRYGPHGRWMELTADEQDPSRSVYRADYDARGRLIRISSTLRAFDYDSKQWTDSTRGWELTLGYNAADQIVHVSNSMLSDGTVTVRSDVERTFNAEGFVTQIERYRDTDIYPCGSERFPAPTERFVNGQYLHRVDRFEYH